MKHKILDNGDLKISIDQEERKELRDLKDDIQTNDAMYDFLEPIVCNSELDWVSPEQIGALTSAPILGIVTRDDEGTLISTDHVWWYPNYCVRSPLEDMRDHGFVIFDKAPEAA